MFSTLLVNASFNWNAECNVTVMPTKSDSDVIFCLKLLCKTLIGTLHLS